MKTTADLPLTEYQRGQLAHLRALMRLQSSSGGSSPSSAKDDAANRTHEESKKERERSQGLKLSDARKQLLSTIEAMKEEEEIEMERSKNLESASLSGSTLLISDCIPEPAKKQRRLPVTFAKKPPVPEAPGVARKPEIGSFTPADTHPTVRKIPPIPVVPQQQQDVWKEEEEEPAPIRLLAMTAYSQARKDVEEKKARLDKLLKAMDAATSTSDDEMSRMRAQAEQLQPELVQAMERLQEAETRLKKLEAKDH